MRRPRAMTRREKPRYDRRPAGRTRSARRRAAGPILLVALLLVGLAAELPLAAAVLPDLMWVRGVYDGGDYDDVLALCVDLCPSSPPPEPAMPPVAVPLSPPAAARAASAAIFPTGRPRAPPLA